MKLFLVSFFCLLLFNESLSKQLASQKLIEPRADIVNVGVYYESFNDDTINFINNQLKLSDTLLKIVKIDLVPWGNTKYEDNVFKCTNGDEECHADRIHACAAYLHSNSAKQLLQFVRCTVQHKEWKSNPANAGNECSNQVDNWMGTWPDIEMCAHLNDSTDINVFLAMKNKTEKLDPPLSKVPTITINDKQNTDALTGLKTAFCNNYNGEKPAECKQVVVGFYYESHDNRTIDFIKNQAQLSDELLSKAGIDFVPWGRTFIDNNTGTFNCTGGTLECLADRIHACAYDSYWSTPKALLRFFTCTVSHELWKSDPAEAGNQCVNSLNDWVDPWGTLLSCATMNDQDDILVFLGMREKTNDLDPKLTSVPWITINGKNSTDAETSLLNAICDNISDGKPAECGPHDTASEIISNKLLIITIALIAVIFSFR